MSGISVTSGICSPNWRNWIEHKIYTVHEKICGLATTESKVHALLVLGRVLQAAALGGLPAAIGCAFVVGPIALLGIIPAVALAILGTWVAENPREINDAVQMGRPFVTGQPVGLSNGRNNCWLNSSLQLVTNVPSFERRMRQVPDLARFLDAYRAAGTGFQKVASEIDTHQIRQLLHRETAGQIASGNVQEDAPLFFEWLFQGPASSLYQFDEVRDGVPSAPQRESMIRLGIERGGANPGFEQLFSRFFDSRTDRGVRQQLFFPTAPEDLMIQVKRFYRDQNGTGKINDPIDTPERFQLPAHLVRSGENASYQCDAFLIHRGERMDAGHYVAYVKRDNAWWYCSDTIVYEVTAADAREAMKHSYIMHYGKTR